MNKLVKTTTPKRPEHAKWHFIDATDQVLGKMAVKVAKILAAKDRAEYTPNVNFGDKVVITNAEKVKVTGNKELGKIYQWHTMYPKGLREATYKQKFDKDPTEVVERAIRGMLPKNRLQDIRMSNLYVYKGAEHPHTAWEKK